MHVGRVHGDQVQDCLDRRALAVGVLVFPGAGPYPAFVLAPRKLPLLRLLTRPRPCGVRSARHTRRAGLPGFDMSEGRDLSLNREQIIGLLTEQGYRPEARAVTATAARAGARERDDSTVCVDSMSPSEGVRPARLTRAGQGSRPWKTLLAGPWMSVFDSSDQCWGSQRSREGPFQGSVVMKSLARGCR